jgi:hypothetical protein
MQQTVKCTNCGLQNPPGLKFCGNCGAIMIVTCANCGATVDPNDKFCGSCGAVVSAVAAPIPASRPAPAAQQPKAQAKPFTAPVPQPEWQAPQSQSKAMEYEEKWSPEASAKGRSSSNFMPMILLLAVLIVALGVFAYLAFGTNVFNKGGGTASTLSTLQITGPFVKPAVVTDNTSLVKDYTIYWETNQPTAGKVDYGFSENYTASVDWETTYSRSHSFILSKLTIGLRYNYRIENKDASGKEVLSGNYTFGAY